MPRTNINYSNTIIYKLCCNDLSITDIYVGQTTDFRKRKNQHKIICNTENNRHYNMYVYKFIRDNGGWDNWDMIEIDRYEAIDGYDAKKRERYWIETLKATLNIYLPSRTQKEYQEDNKEKIKEYKKEWRGNNKELITQKLKEWYDINKELLLEKHKEKIVCECGCKIRKDGLRQHKQSKKHIDLISKMS